MQAYVFHLSRAGRPEPDVLLVVVPGERRARELAGEILGRSPDHLAIEAWLDGARAFALSARDGAGA